MLGRVFVAVLHVRQADMGVGIAQDAVHQAVDHLIHLYILAVVADPIDSLDTLNAKSLKHKRRLQLGPIQLRDEHAELELVDVNVNFVGDHTSCCACLSVSARVLGFSLLSKSALGPY